MYGLFKERGVRKLAVLLVLFSFFLPARAAVITVHDGQSFDFDAANTYVFADGLTTADPQVTYGFILTPDDDSFVRVSAPAGIDLVARLTTGADYGGTTIVGGYGGPIPPGEHFDFPLWGWWTGIGAGSIWWLTIGIFDNDALTALATVYGGELPMSDTLLGTNFLSPPDTGGGTGDTGGGNNGGGSTVPTPSSLILMATGLLLGAIGRKKAKG